jgi:hypothetical protein
VGIYLFIFLILLYFALNVTLNYKV